MFLGEGVRWNFRNLFAVVIWGSSVVLYALHGLGAIQLPEMILGSLISVDTLVAQFYFRKKGVTEGEEK